MNHASNIYLFFGPPGSGKGTLSALCVKHFGWQHLSTGDLCREHIALGTDIGKEIKQATAAGKLVSDEIVTRMVQDWLVANKQLKQAVIMDGYPRTLHQAHMFQEMLEQKLPSVEIILVKLHVPVDVLISRIANRIVCSNKTCGAIYSLAADSTSQPRVAMVCDICTSDLLRRADDSAIEIAMQRLKTYEQHEQEIVDFYRAKHKQIIILDGAQTGLKVFQDFAKLVQPA